MCSPGLSRREDISMSATDELVSRSITAAAEETPMLAVKEIVEQTLRDKRVEAELSTDVGLRVLHLSDDLTVLNVVAPRRRDRVAGDSRPSSRARPPLRSTYRRFCAPVGR
jgi:hypothetical protein